MHQISWEDSIWFFDIDDTLITTTTSEITLLGSNAVKDMLLKQFSEKDAEKLRKDFVNIFNILLAGHRGNHTPEYQNLINKIDAYQVDIKNEFGATKRWSREIFLKIAADKNNLQIPSDLLNKTINYYWKSISENAVVLPHVKEFMDLLIKHNKRIYLVTGSDARLVLKDNNQFSYNPISSEQFKQSRLLPLKNKGIPYTFACIGDPIDKPHKVLFQKAFQMAQKDLGHKINPKSAIIVGDSYSADLATPLEQLSFGLGILYKNGLKKTEVISDNQINLGNLLDITQFLKTQ